MTESRACIRTHPDALEDSSIVRRDQNVVHVLWRQVNLGPERDLDTDSDGFYSAMSETWDSKDTGSLNCANVLDLNIRLR